MRKNHVSIAVKFFLAGLLFSACKKQISVPIEAINNSTTYLKVYIASPGATRNYVFINDRQVTGAALTAGGLFPLSSASQGIAFPHNSLFSVQLGEMRPIAQKISIRDTALVTAQPVTNVVTNLETLSNYTLFLADSSLRPRAILVKDDMPPVGDTAARLRFANLPFSPLAIPNVDIFSVKARANIFTNAPVGMISEFKPFASALNDTLHVRAAGTTANLASVNGFLATRGRYYTIVFRGSYRNPGSRVLGTFVNR
jgi:hypothetical protein